MNKKTIIVIGAAIIIAIVGACSYFLFYNSPEEKYKRYLELGNRYFEEMDYELAEANLLEAIDIEPKKEDAYLALANLYCHKSDYKSAIAILEQGQNVIDSGLISEKYKNDFIFVYEMLLKESVSDDDAMECAEKLLELDSENKLSKAFVEEAEMKKEKARKFKEKVPEFEEKLDELLESLTIMGQPWDQVDYSNAISQYNLEESEPGSGVYKMKGDQLLYDGFHQLYEKRGKEETIRLSMDYWVGEYDLKQLTNTNAIKNDSYLNENGLRTAVYKETGNCHEVEGFSSWIEKYSCDDISKVEETFDTKTLFDLCNDEDKESGEITDGEVFPFYRMTYISEKYGEVYVSCDYVPHNDTKGVFHIFWDKISGEKEDAEYRHCVIAQEFMDNYILYSYSYKLD